MDEQTISRLTDELDGYLGQLDEQTNEVRQVCYGVAAAAESPVVDATNDAVRVPGEVSGQVDVATDPQIQAVGAITERVIADATRPIDQTAGQISATGVNYPADVGVQSAMLDADPAEWVPAVIGVPADATAAATTLPPVVAPVPPTSPPPPPPPPPFAPPSPCLPGVDYTFPSQGWTIDPNVGAIAPDGSIWVYVSFNTIDSTIVVRCATGTAPPPPPPPPGPCDVPAGPGWAAAVASSLNAQAGFPAWYVDGPTRVCTISWGAPGVPADWPHDRPYCVERTDCPGGSPVPPPPPPVPPPPPPGGSCPAACPPPVINVTCPPPTVPPTVPPPAPPYPVPPPPPFPGVPPPPPPPPVGGPSGNPVKFLPIPEYEGVVGVDWSNPNICKNVQENITLVIPSVGSVKHAVQSFSPFSKLATGLADVVSYLTGDPYVPTFEPDREWYDSQTRDNQQLVSGTTMVDQVFERLGGAFVNNPGTVAYLGSILSLAEVGERRTGWPITYLAQGVMYAYQWLNPQYLPSQPEINQLWVTDRIDDGTFECLTRAQGNLPYWSQLSAEMLVGRPNPPDLVRLLLRGELTLDQFRKRMDDVGWSVEQYQDDLRRLAVAIPQQPDLLRFMVRDVADPNVVQKYNYDFEFGDKFQGQLKKWAAAQGIPEEIFLYYWRAHWNIPSDTQLRDILSRCRPDRPEVTDYEVAFATWQGQGSVGDPPPKPVVVTDADVRNALQVNDLAPGWVDAVMKNMYRPITNSDAIRAYILGAFDEEKLHAVFRDNNYSEEDAKTLVDYWRSQAVQRVANQSGVLTQRAVSKLYKDGAVDRITADKMLVPLMPNPRQRTDLLDRLDDQIAAENVQTVIKLIRSKYMHAALDDAGLQLELLGAGVDPQVIPRLADQYKLERDNKSRDATAAMLCKWHVRGLIDAAEYYRRLRILGYADTDARRIIQVCEQDEALRQAKAAAAANRQARTDWDKAIKILIALDPTLKAVLGPLIGQPPGQSSGSSGGSGGKGGKGGKG